MAAIQSAIELQDNFTDIMYQMIDSVYLGLAAMEDLQQSMNTPMDITSMETVRESINQTTLAVQELDAAMQGIANENTDLSALVDLPVSADVSKSVTVSLHWQPIGIDTENVELEQLNDQFIIAETEATGIEISMLQLVQVMSAGVLLGEEYSNILGQIPNILQLIAAYMEIPKGQLKDMAAQGQITANSIATAMSTAVDTTKAKFESMPKKFSEVLEFLQGQVLLSVQPLLGLMTDLLNGEAITSISDAITGISDKIAEKISTLVNSEEFITFTDTLISGLQLVSWIALETIDVLAGAAGIIADNWSWLAPIILGVAAALLVYAGSLALVKMAEIIGTAIKIIMCLANLAYAAATGTAVSATLEHTAAQYGLNVAILSCPLVWIIFLIIALIAIFYAVIAAINKFAGTSISATGIICGIFMLALAVIGNILITLLNFVINIFAVIWNFIAAFANFLANVFNDPVGAIARLFFDLADVVLGVLETLASAVDTIFGPIFGWDLSGAIAGWRESLGDWADKTFGKGEEVMKKIDVKDLRSKPFDYRSAWDKGYSFGSGIDESIENFDPSSLFGQDNMPSTDEYMDKLLNGGSGGDLGENGGGSLGENGGSSLGEIGGSLGAIGGDLGAIGGGLGTIGIGNFGEIGGSLEGIGAGVEDIAGNTGAIADSMDITEEDLKYLRDIAEQEVLNRFTTAEIQIEQTNHNNFKNGNDLDGIVSGLTEAVNEAVVIMTEGVHK